MREQPFVTGFLECLRYTKLHFLHGFKEHKVSKEKNSCLSKDLVEKIKNFDSELIFDGVNICSNVRGFLVFLWQKQAYSFFNSIESIKELFKQEDFESVLVDEDKSPLKNACIQIAKKHNVRSYVNCHGDPFHKIGFLPLTADYLLAWGNHQEDVFKNWGLAGERTLVTGCSKYDLYANRTAESVKEGICKDLGFSISKPICVIAPTPLVERRNILENTIWQRIKEAITVASEFENMQIIIKLHPGDDNELQIQALLNDLDHKYIKILKDYDALKLAKGCDLLIVHASTFAIDGLAYKKPVILTDKYCMHKYGYLDIFYDGTNKDKLKNSIKDLIDNRADKHVLNWQMAVNRCLNGADKVASKTIVEILTKDE